MYIFQEEARWIKSFGGKRIAGWGQKEAVNGVRETKQKALAKIWFITSIIWMTASRVQNKER